MSLLTLFSQFNLRNPYFVSSDVDELREQLLSDGVHFDRWPLRHEGKDCYADESKALSLYQKEIEQVKAQFDCLHAELICACDVNGSAISLRGRSLSEHTHTDPEIRFFLSGEALIYVHVKERIHIIQCQAGDFVVIPADMPHWFDMGPDPSYACLRWFNSREGLRKHFTGSYMAESTPRWEGVIK